MTDETPPDAASETPEPQITPEQLEEQLGLTDLDVAFGLFDQLLAIAEKEAAEKQVDGAPPSSAIPALRLFYAGAARLLQHFDERIAELLEAQRDTQAILLASAPNKVTAALKERYNDARAAAATAGEDPDELPGPDDLFEAQIDRVDRVAQELNDGDDDEDPDAPPPLSKVE